VAVRRDDGAEEIAKSPKFRWRERGAAPPESPEILTCLAALEGALAAAGWERTDGSDGEWCARQFRRAVAPLSERIRPYVAAPDEDMIRWLSAQTTAPADDEIEAARDDSARVIAIREAAQRHELDRLAAERLQADRLLLARRETERLERELLEAARAEAEQNQAEPADPRTLPNRFVADTANHRRVEIPASFEAEALPPRIRIWNRKHRQW